MGTKKGWYVKPNKRDAGKRYDAGAWDPKIEKYRTKRWDDQAEAEKWAKAEHAKFVTGQASAGRADVKALITDFIADMKARKVVEDYRVEVERILLSAYAAGVTDLKHPRVRQTAKDWLAGLETVHPTKKGRAVSPWTIHRHLRALRAFGNWAVIEGHISANPFKAVRVERMPDTTKPKFTIDELCRLVNPWHQLDPFYLTACLLVYTGARFGEAVHFRWEWLHWAANRIRLQNWKGMEGANVDRRLKFAKSRSIMMLAEFVKIFKPRMPKSETGWIVPDEIRLLTPRAQLDRFALYCGSCGVVLGTGAAKRTPHSTRHTWVTLKLATDENEIFVQAQAGHNELSTTSGYAKGIDDYRHQVADWITQAGPGEFVLQPVIEKAKEEPNMERLNNPYGLRIVGG